MKLVAIGSILMFLSCATAKTPSVTTITSSKESETVESVPAPTKLSEEEKADQFFQQQAFKESAAAYRALLETDPNNGKAWLRKALSHHFLGQYKEATQDYMQAEKLSFDPPLVAYNIACVYALQQEKEKSLSWLEKAVQRGFAQIDTLRNDADLKLLHEEPRFQTILASMTTNSNPCDKESYRQFDFWLGTWNVNSTDKQVGESRVEAILDGCVLLENWSSPSGYAGKSFNRYNALTKTWEQFWVDNKGKALNFTGTLQNDGSLRFTGETIGADGTKVLQKMTFFPLEKKEVRQLIESSKDQGENWKVEFDAVYTPQY